MNENKNESVNMKRGQLTAEFCDQIRKALIGKPFKLFCDHSSSIEDAGKIASWFEKPYGRPTQLSHIDIAVVKENSNKIAVLIEIEETNDKPKTYLGDIFCILMGEYIRCGDDEEMAVEEDSTIFIFGKSKVPHENRNSYIRDKVMKIKPLLSSANSKVSDIVIASFSTKEKLFDLLPSVLDSIFKGKL